jgi:excisionase family DNA binding protein
MNAATLPTVMTLAEVAHWLARTRGEVRRMARAGQIPSRRLPTGELLFDRGELSEWLRGLPRAAEPAGA